MLERINKFRDKIKKLEKKDIDLIIVDFDDTIFCTNEVIDGDYRNGRRGAEGNEYLLENNLIDKVINECYIGKSFPKTIVSKLRKNHDLILTVGIEDFQIPKLEATGMNKFNFTIVETASEKIYETVNYITNTLGFIPNKITVYEDRPKFFLENIKYLEEIIGTKIEIMLVEMNGNENEPHIKKIN